MQCPFAGVCRLFVCRCDKLEVMHVSLATLNEPHTNLIYEIALDENGKDASFPDRKRLTGCHGRRGRVVESIRTCGR